MKPSSGVGVAHCGNPQLRQVRLLERDLRERKVDYLEEEVHSLEVPWEENLCPTSPINFRTAHSKSSVSPVHTKHPHSMVPMECGNSRQKKSCSMNGDGIFHMFHDFC